MIKHKRKMGEYLTPVKIFKEYILPEIKSSLYDYIWVDLFAGEGNLILPILELIPESQRIDYFKDHIFLFDIQDKMISRAINKVKEYNIPEDIAANNIIRRDTIKDYPEFLLHKKFPIFHITNPPYLYIGYMMKHKEMSDQLKYFNGNNKGYQDLYQLAMINDMRHNIMNMIYIIPANFLYGYSVSNKIRKDFLKYYTITKSFIFEKRIFEYTGTNVMISFFKRKNIPSHDKITFNGYKINNNTYTKSYTLYHSNNYRAGSEFDDFIEQHIQAYPLKVKYYLTIKEVEENPGNYKVVVIDVNDFDRKKYKKKDIYVNKWLYNKIKSNILFIRTLDTGNIDGRVGLYKIKDVFGVDGILVSGSKYRTYPIQIFIEPTLTYKEQEILMDYFNDTIEYLRDKTDSDFMTTYKYSNSEYTRKYLGLTQARKIIQTFSWLDLKDK